jgi:predicted DNA-binding transcriptional regulator AlpA
MPDIVKDTRYLRTKEAAHYVGLSARTLEKHRTYGTGPAYKKVGGRVIYAIDELRAWADRGACTSTSDPNNHAVPPAVRRDPADTAEDHGGADADKRGRA